MGLPEFSCMGVGFGIWSPVLGCSSHEGSHKGYVRLFGVRFRNRRVRGMHVREGGGLLFYLGRNIRKGL